MRACLASFASVSLLTLSAEPFGQWYLAWFALAPWLIVIGKSTSLRTVFSYGWLTGALYFAVNLWWLWTATIPGTIGVIIYFGMYWGVAAAIIHYLRLVPATDQPSPGSPAAARLAGPWWALFQILGIACVWVAAEWLRCNVLRGFPWMPIGSTQSPLLVMCQVADIGGPWIVSFWLMLMNGLVTIAWIYRRARWQLLRPSVAIAGCIAVVALYGVWRLRTAPNKIGPRVMVIQSNAPQLRGGTPTVTPQQSVEFFLGELKARLSDEPVDLVILPENEFPPINDEARSQLARSTIGPFLESTYQRLRAIAHDHDVALVVGGVAVTGWTTEGQEHIGSEIRNSAYYFSPRAGTVTMRYDKMHLVPYSERIPFSDGPAWLHKILLRLAASRAVQPLRAGKLDDLQPFVLHWTAPAASLTDFGVTGEPGIMTAARRTRFITPICLENIDPAVVANMLRDPVTGKKRAGFLANLSNDGWFNEIEKYQHIQSLVFRCIENRVPMARSSNTGISGFVASTGRVEKTVAPDTVGMATQRIVLDDRTTIYTRWGDVFPLACLGAVAALVLARRAIKLIEKRPSESAR